MAYDLPRNAPRPPSAGKPASVPLAPILAILALGIVLGGLALWLQDSGSSSFTPPQGSEHQVGELVKVRPELKNPTPATIESLVPMDGDLLVSVFVLPCEGIQETSVQFRPDVVNVEARTGTDPKRDCSGDPHLVTARVSLEQPLGKRQPVAGFN